MRRALALAALLGVAGAAARRAVTLATVRGTSMTPTYADGERVLAVRRHRYRAGDVVVFRAPAEQVSALGPAWRIKRVAAVGGDPTPDRLRTDPGSLVPAPVVPARHVVVVGDRAGSQDSRQLGYVPLAAIAGRVLPARPVPVSRPGPLPPRAARSGWPGPRPA